MIFSLTKEQQKKYREWSEDNPEDYVGAAGGATSFKFTPTGIGTIVEVLRISGDEEKILNLTDYDDF